MSKKILTPKLIKDAQKENPFAKLGEIVYQILETQILSLSLDPGSKLRINSIAEDLNISATPVREAIDMLEEKGLVVAGTGSGGKYKSYTVFDIDDKEVQDLFKAYAPEMSCASWAIRFVASLDGILTVLSGMSNIPQMEDNISYMKDFQPLNAEEREIIRKAQRILGQSATIPCTACHYCTKGCPMQIPIPEIFAAQNDLIGNGQTDQAKEAYRKLAGAGHVASDCIGCGQCESVCPQHIQIIGKLKECAASLE